MGIACAKKEGHARPVSPGGVSGSQLGDNTGCGLARGDRCERFAQLFPALGNHSDAAGEMRSACIGSETDVRKAVFGMVEEMFLVAAREIFDGLFSPRGERQNVAR